MTAPQPPRVRETVVQTQIVRALRLVGARVYVLGHPPRRDQVHKGTGQTPGVPDLLVMLPASPREPFTQPHQLWIEVKARGGRLSPAQESFRDFCYLADVPHLVGGLDDVVQYLHDGGYIKELVHYRKRKA